MHKHRFGLPALTLGSSWTNSRLLFVILFGFAQLIGHEVA